MSRVSPLHSFQTFLCFLSLTRSPYACSFRCLPLFQQKLDTARTELTAEMMKRRKQEREEEMTRIERQATERALSEAECKQYVIDILRGDRADEEAPEDMGQKCTLRDAITMTR